MKRWGLNQYEEESLKKIYELDHYLRDRTLKDSDNQRMRNELGRHFDQGNLTMFLEDPEVEPTQHRRADAQAGDRRPQGVAMFQDGAGSQCLRGIQECALDSLAARSEFRIQVACQNHRGRAYPCMRCLWRLLVRSANQLRFINRGKNPKKIVAGAFGIRLIWNLPKHQTLQPKSHLQ